MQAETKTCQSCKQDFDIAPDDFEFYEKIQVPPPTWCPECRLKRRLAYYVDILKPRMYARKCDATGKELISMYPPNAKFPVYDRAYWYSDKWDPMSYARNYDFSRPFFEQFHELQMSVPRYHTSNSNSENCLYSKAATNSKNCYLCTGWQNENCLYSSGAFCKEIVDCWFIGESELSYSCINCEKCYRVFYSNYAYNCSDSAFLYDCKNCSNCFGCVNLRNKSYCIFNVQYTKEAYYEEIKKFNLGSFGELEKIKKNFLDFKKKQPHIFAFVSNSENVTGDNIQDSKNSFECFDAVGLQDCKYASLVGTTLSDSYDCYDAGESVSLMYEAVASGDNTFNIRFAYFVGTKCSDVTYSDLCTNTDHLFGCVGLSKKSYCILNKQYTKEEYEALVPRIIKHMDAMPYKDTVGRVYGFGEFFPPELSPFSYQNSSAQDFFPLAEEKAQVAGYHWQNYEVASAAPTLEARQIPDDIDEIPDTIVKEVIRDNEGHSYKIIQQELDFYQKMNIAIPRKCPVCRFEERVAKRNPMKLWPRKCECSGELVLRSGFKNHEHHFHGRSKCPNTFETSFAPDREEAVYCKQCFENELIS